MAEKGDLRARHKFRHGWSSERERVEGGYIPLSRPSLIYGVVRLVVRSLAMAVRMISMLHILGGKPTDDKPENTPLLCAIL